MADILFQYGQVDMALGYVSPEVIALQGKEAVLPSLHLAQAALSAYHPDRVSEDDTTVNKGSSALAQLNQLIAEFEADDGSRLALLKDCEDTSRENVALLQDLHHIDEAIKSAKHHMVSLVALEPVSTDAEVEVYTGKKNIYADSRLLNFIVGPRIIELIQTSTDETKEYMLRQLRNKLFKGEFSILSSLGVARVNQLFDQYIESERSLGTTGNNIDVLENSHHTSEPLTDVKESLKDEEKRIDSEVITLLNQLKPGSNCEFPEDWVRSYTGSIIIPTDESLWLNYNYNFINSRPQELGVFKELIIKDGIVTAEIVIDTTQRSSVEVIQNLDNDKKKWIQSLIALAANAVDYPVDQFVLEFGNGADKYLEPMDFIFKVSDTGDVSILYNRAKAAGSTNEPILVFKASDHPSLEGGIAPNAGYYMVKAGKIKSSGEYSISDAPLALICLEPEVVTAKRSKYIGKAAIVSLPSTSDGYLDEVLVLSDVSEGITDGKKAKFGTSLLVKSNDVIKMVKQGILGISGVDSFFKKPLNEQDKFNNQMIMFLDKNRDALVVNTLEAHRARFEN